MVSSSSSSFLSPSPSSSPSLRPWPYPRVLAHRGGGVLAPENTIAALRCGLAHGFHAVEFDAMLSRDAVPVLMHDPSFGRTVPGSGNVSDFSAAQLMQMDAGSWFGAQFAAEPVPSLAQVIQFCRQHGIWMNIEIKPAPGFEAITGHEVARMTRATFADDKAQYGAAHPGLPLLSSFSHDALVAARSAAPELALGCLFDVIPPDWQARLLQLGACALHTNQKHLRRELAQAVKQAGYGLFCYTVNDPARALEILGWGVDGFCTDRIDLIGAAFPA
jgi:glycerophosphoryl diester phosphodiesterase